MCLISQYRSFTIEWKRFYRHTRTYFIFTVLQFPNGVTLFNHYVVPSLFFPLVSRHSKLRLCTEKKVSWRDEDSWGSLSLKVPLHLTPLRQSQTSLFLPFSLFSIPKIFLTNSNHASNIKTNWLFICWTVMFLYELVLT